MERSSGDHSIQGTPMAGFSVPFGVLPWRRPGRDTNELPEIFGGWTAIGPDGSLFGRSRTEGGGGSRRMGDSFDAGWAGGFLPGVSPCGLPCVPKEGDFPRRTSGRAKGPSLFPCPAGDPERLRRREGDGPAHRLLLVGDHGCGRRIPAPFTAAPGPVTRCQDRGRRVAIRHSPRIPTIFIGKFLSSHDFSIYLPSCISSENGPVFLTP